MGPLFSILNDERQRDFPEKRAGDMTDLATAPPTIANMLRRCSIEVNPSDPNAVDAALGRLDRGTEVFLTWIPGANPKDLIEQAVKLSRAGLCPVPHIGARHLESEAQLQQLAERLVGDAGVDRILLIAGDRAQPAGPYDSSLSVMQTGVFQNADITRVAVAGFPEGNPHIPEVVLNEALAAKVNFGRGAGLQLSIVTQFCFEAEPIVAWLQRLRARGIDVPVRIGLAGPARLVTLARYAMRCGIGNSVRVLTEQPSFAKLLTDKGPEPIIQGIAALVGPGSRGMLPLGIAGLHFFVFGGLNRTVDWINSRRTQ